MAALARAWLPAGSAPPRREAGAVMKPVADEARCAASAWRPHTRSRRARSASARTPPARTASSRASPTGCHPRPAVIHSIAAMPPAAGSRTAAQACPPARPAPRASAARRRASHRCCGSRSSRPTARRRRSSPGCAAAPGSAPRQELLVVARVLNSATVPPLQRLHESRAQRSSIRCACCTSSLGPPETVATTVRTSRWIRLECVPSWALCGSTAQARAALA